MNEILTLEQKLEKLSPELRGMIKTQKERDAELTEYLKSHGNSQGFTKGVISDFLGRTMLHCNGGATMDAAFWLRDHLKNGGKLAITIAGALSSFEIGVLLAELIRENKVHMISATAANHEESYYRYVAHSHYAYIPNYTEITPLQEAELRDAGLRRITDTFLPEDESVRIIEPHLVEMWEQAEKDKTKLFPDEYFRSLFANDLIKSDPLGNPDHCWAYAAHQKGVPVVIPGFEDSTMGNIFASYTYSGICKKLNGKVIDSSVMKTGVDYFSSLYELYMKMTEDSSLAMLQLGGGIAADFLICIVPSLKHDLGVANVKDWKGFIEIGSSPMSYGSYAGAGGKEKITWDKLSVDSYYKIIQSDVTLAFPAIAAVLLGK